MIAAADRLRDPQRLDEILRARVKARGGDDLSLDPAQSVAQFSPRQRDALTQPLGQAPPQRARDHADHRRGSLTKTPTI
jgi:hypothetical protein